MQENMLIGIHQRPKSIFKFLILSLQHVFAMFGSNVLVPMLVNESAGYEVIPIQVAFFCSGIGTIIYLCMTGFKVPIYLGSSFAYLGAMTSLWSTSGYNIFLSLMIVGIIYIVVAGIIHFTKGQAYIKKILSPIIVGPAIMMIGLSLMTNAAKDSYLNPAYANNLDLGSRWALIVISILTFSIIVFCFVFTKKFLKMIPILIALAFGTLFALMVWGIANGTGNSTLSETIFPSSNLNKLTDYKNWNWYPDITNMWAKSPIANNDWSFKSETLLAIIPLSIITMSEHIGDHINIGNITGNDFISKKPGLSRTLIGDGIATIVSASMGGPANTSYGENTSVIVMTKIASVWVIFTAACMSIAISFIAPISQIIAIIPKPVIGGVEIILFSLIAINGLKLLINYKIDFSKPKNIIIFSLISVMGLGGVVFDFSPEIALSGTGVAIIISIFLNILLPTQKDDVQEYIQHVDLAPSDITNNLKNIRHKSKKIFSNIKKKKNKKDKKEKD